MMHQRRSIFLRALIAGSWLLAWMGVQPLAAHATGATATGLQVSFSAAGPCSVGSPSLGANGTTTATVTITGAGQCAITASQPGDGTYAAATDVVRSFMVARAPTSISLSSIADTPYHDPVALSATVSPASIGSQTLAGTVIFSIDGTPVGSAPVNSSGLASVSPTVTQGVGKHSVTASFTSTNSNFADSSTASAGSFSVTPEDTTLTYVGDSSADFHDSPTFKAKLLEDGDATKPLAGKDVTFTLGTQTCGGKTGSDGIASCSLTVNAAPGLVSSVSAAFAGDTNYVSSATGNAPFTIKKEETGVRYTGPTQFPVGSSATVSASLGEDSSTALSGKSVRITVGTGSSSKSCTGSTSSLGVASCLLGPLPVTAGQYPISASFDGDTNYLPAASPAQPAILFAFPARGAFVIGDTTAAANLNKTVAFWGTQWSSQNQLSGGPAPSSFFGFARTLARTPPICGTTWSTTPGASSLQPPVNVPTYMAVIVAGKISKSGAAITGDTRSIGIVHTAGGSAGPGTLGTGTLLATFCPAVNKVVQHATRGRLTHAPSGHARDGIVSAPRHIGVQTSTRLADPRGPFRYAPVRPLRAGGPGASLPVTRLAQGYAPTRSAGNAVHQHLRRQATGTKSQQIQFDALPDKTFGDAPFQISATSVTQPVNPGGVPPDPSTVASPIDGTVATTIGANTSFLYSGDNPIQTGVAPGTIDPVRAAVLKGKVLDSSGNPLSGVTVAILNHPELGQTLSRADGAFDLAVNGGGQLTVTYAKQQYLPAQRQIDAPWQDYATLPDVVLLQLDPNVAPIDLTSSAPIQVAQGSVQSDADGARQATLFFQQGTAATMTLPNGSTQPLSMLHVRATEYTVGTNGPAAMPGDLPPTSGYTYAAEYSIDEARDAGATEVQFSRPVISYTENFLNFPVGTTVPAGHYDLGTGVWIPDPNGRVISILSITNGRTDLDVDGSGTAADTQTLSVLGISDAERTQLAALYKVGTALWRTPLDHFTVLDFNWPYGPPPDAQAPHGPDPHAKRDPKNDPDPCKKAGSIIGCLGQSLGQDVPVTGTPFTLHYESARSAGQADAYTVPIPLSDATVPSDLLGIQLQIEVAGRYFTQSFPALPNQTYTFTWDGKDAYGREVQGVQPLRVHVGYTYAASYHRPAGATAQAFAEPGLSATINPARQEVTIWREFDTHIGTWRTRLEGLGGWTLDVHHAYDPASRILYLGDGTTRGTDPLTYNGDIAAVAGGSPNGCSGVFTPTCGDGGPATNAFIDSPAGLAVDAQGAGYIAQQGSSTIRRIGRDGIISTVAGTGAVCANSTDACGDGGPATQAQLNGAPDVAVGPDGSLYIADDQDHRVRKVDPSGTIHTIAGTGVYGYSGDGGPATQATFKHPVAVAVGPDGAIYIADGGTLTIRKIALDGTIVTVAGTGNGCVNGLDENVADGTPATSGPLCVLSPGLAVGRDGSIIFAQDSGNIIEKVRKIGTDGIVRTIAGTGPICRNTATDSCGDGGPATQAGLSGPDDVAVGPDGTVYIADGGNSHERVRHIEADGIIESVASRGDTFSAPPVAPAGAADLYTIDGIAVVPDGSIDVALHDRRQVLHVTPTLPALSTGNLLIPSAGGTELYVFDGAGRHLSTLDAITGALLYRFTYDSGNRLTSVTDGDGNVTTIQHDGFGNPAAIIAPGGEITTLTTDGHGYLNSIADQLGNTYDLTSDADGLLRTLRDPNGNLHSFNYNADGLLTEDDDPVGGSTTLARTTNGPGDYSVAVTTALGRTTTYSTKSDGVTGTVSTTTPSGATTTVTVAPNATTTETYPDGTTLTVVQSADPRWGMLAPIASSATETTPGGVTSTVSETRTATLSTPSNPLSLTTLTDAVTVNGRTYTGAYNASSHRFTTSSPTGKTTATYLDSKDHVTEIDLPDGADAITATYNTKGDPVTVQQGSRSLTFSYDGRERLSSTQDAAGNTTQYGYDSADRITSITLPNGEIYRQDYDRNGNVTALTMPSGAEHLLDSTAVDQLSRYTPPGNTGAYTFDYNKDGDLLHSSLPGGRTETYASDSSGRLTSVNYPEGQNLFSYSGPTELVTGILHTSPADTQVEALNIGYDGSLPTSMQVQGTTSAQYGYTFNPDQLLSGIAFSSGTDSATTSITRNADSLITGYGPFTIDRNGPDGRPSGIHDGTLAMSLAYDHDGRVTSRSQTVRGASSYSETLSYNAAGLISRKVETVGGTSHTYDYAYNRDGALTLVQQDNQNVEQYGYDPNGNRTSAIVGTNATQTATYDVEDRLTKLGNTTYSFNGDGFLQSRGSDSFTYDTHGELLSATVGGTTATYTYDGVGRRIAETTPAGTLQYYYGNPDDPYQVTEARDTAGNLTRLFYDEGGLFYAMQVGNSRYYVATDQVGTPRVVTDGTGAIVRQLAYDSYGNLTADSNSGFFLPIGFAGGIADPTAGLVHFQFRDYDPASGRWVERDPSLFAGGQGNLYAYVGDSPIGLRDPTGLFCMGGSSYEGIGGGADYCISTKGISVCAELGFGTGGSINVNPFGDPMQNYFGVQAEASAGSKGVFGVFADTGWNAYDISGDCLGIQGNAGVEGASHQLKLWNLQKGFKPDYKKTKLPWDNDKANDKLGKLGVSAKLVVKVCQNANW